MKYQERIAHSAVTNGKANDGLNICNVGSRSQSKKPVLAIVRVVTLAALAVMIIAAQSAQAQTESVLYSFTGTPDGQNPTSRLTLSNGNLYGTTLNGGLYGNGSVFELSPNGSGGWTETLLYSFCPAAPSCTDGQNPELSYVILDAEGNLYGTTYAGGALGNGAVFELSPSGGTWNENVLYSFAGQPDGANPVQGLVMDTAGNLYGTTYNGGGGNNGAVFELSPTGSGGWNEQVIASINALYSGLTMTGGNLYGTTATTVFEMEPNASGGWKGPITLFTFSTSAQGTTPNGTLVVETNGTIYGTTMTGGTNNLGTVYKLTKERKYTESILYSFGSNGTEPFAGVVTDSTGNIYGTTMTGGGKNNAGVVYELATTRTGVFQEQSLQAFVGENGGLSYAGLILDGQNYLYGTTYGGGADGEGTVFIANAHAQTTTTTVVSSLNPSTHGQAVTFTATVTPAPPDGEVVVFEPVGQAAMTNGVATYTTSALKAGTTAITAVYNGDLNFITSTSTPLTQTVKR